MVNTQRPACKPHSWFPCWHADCGTHPPDSLENLHRLCPCSGHHTFSPPLETTVLLQHKVRNDKYVFWDPEGSLVRGWLRCRRKRSGEDISTSSALQGGINHRYIIAKRRGNRPAKKHCGPWPEGPAAAGRGLGSPPGSSTDPSRVSFCEVPILSVPTTEALGQDSLALHVYSAEHARLGPSSGGGCAMGWLLWQQQSRTNEGNRWFACDKISDAI